MVFLSPRFVLDLLKRLFSRSRVGSIAFLLCAPMLMSEGVLAQQVDGADADKQTIQMLIRRIDELEARVAQLEASKAPAPTASEQVPNPRAPGPPPIDSEASAEHSEPERMDMTKTLLNNGSATSLDQAVEDEARCQTVNISSGDTAEAMMAFVEKREPRFQGH